MKYKIEINTDHKLYTDKIEIALAKLLSELDKNFNKKDLKRVNYNTEIHITASYKNAIRIKEDIEKQEVLI